MDDRNRPDRRHAGAGPEPEIANATSVFRAAFMFAIAFYLASMGYREMFAASLSGLLMICAIVSVFGAVMRTEPLRADAFGRWDEAAWLLALSFVAAAAVDPETIRQLSEQPV